VPATARRTGTSVRWMPDGRLELMAAAGSHWDAREATTGIEPV
jgi:hypothetical protein